MTQYTQYARKCSLIVADNFGSTIDLSALKITFQVRQFELNTPTNMFVRIYNLNEATSKRILTEFTNVKLQAGYEEGNFGTIFQGDIKYFKRGRANAVDSFLDIFAADSDLALNFSVINKTQSAALTGPQDQLDLVQKSLAENGVEKGSQCELADTRLPRGKVFYGPAKKYLRDICVTNGITASIVGGKLQTVAANGYTPEPIIVLNSRTGMIGIPEQTPDGINVTMLLNPNIKVGQRLQIDNASINQQNNLGGESTFDFVPFDQYAAAPQFLAKLDDDGMYRVVYSEYFGDTRGDEWYTKCICLSLGTSVIPFGLVQRGLGL